MTAVAVARRRWFDKMSNEDDSVESVSTGEYLQQARFDPFFCLFVKISIWILIFVGESGEELSQALKFYEVDAPGDDYVDFGAYTGPHGSFSWHANYPLEK